MSANLISPTQGVFTGATFIAGALKWLSVNSEAITPLAMLVTAMGALVFGFLNYRNGRIRAMSTIEANRISDLARITTKRRIIEALLTDLDEDGKETYTTEDIKLMLRK